MITFKCKMCGGTLEFEQGSTVVECPYCGSKQTLPRLDNEKRANLYDRANHFRRQNEYDKAMAIYEQILQDDRTDAEAYWSIVLCRYGIEYVEDPSNKKRIPTMNRLQYVSIMADEDYKSALEYADDSQRAIYESEAQVIDRIQGGILSISQHEKPFDVFICYKENDAEGRRTPDSVLANDLYHQLTNEGFKVFFSRITLEDKIGTAFEPYIFAALNSAKVMVVLGTKPEYFNAVWVKNEWSRFLALIRAGANKVLVPAYRDMDPYDMPDEFSHLQAQDMSKLGFMQDLIRGIKKLTANNFENTMQPVSRQDSATGGANITALLDRAYFSLEDSDWEKADEFCEKALNIDARNARAYIGKLMVELKVRRETDLQEQLYPLDNNGNYLKAIRFGTDEQKKTLEKYNALTKIHIEHERLKSIMDGEMRALKTANTIPEIQCIRNRIFQLKDFPDKEKGIATCDEKIEHINNLVYKKAENFRDNGYYEKAAKVFSELGDYQDSKTAAEECSKLYAEQQREIAEQLEAEQRLEEERKAAERRLEEEERRLEEERKAAERRLEEERKAKEREIARAAAKMKAQEEEIARKKAELHARKTKRTVIALLVTFVFAVAVLIVTNLIILPRANYNKAIQMLQSDQYNLAIRMFTDLNGYSDSDRRIQQCEANKAFNAEKYSKVAEIYAELPEEYQDYKDAMIQKYNNAVSLMDAGKYDDAIVAFTNLGCFGDSNDKTKEAKYLYAEKLKGLGEDVAAAKLYSEIAEYKDSEYRAEQISADILFQSKEYAKAWEKYDTLPEEYRTYQREYEEMFNVAEELKNAGKYDEAVKMFDILGTYKAADEQVLQSKYLKADSLSAAGDYDSAINIFEELQEYSDSKDRAVQATANKYYDVGEIAAAYLMFASLDETYQNHMSDYTVMYAEAEKMMASGDYNGAYKQFWELGEFSDASEKALQCSIQIADALFNAGKYEEAATAYSSIGDNINACRSLYKYAGQLMAQGEYLQAAQQYFAISGYEDSREKHYQMAEEALNVGNLADAYTILCEDMDYPDTKDALYRTGITASERALYEVSVPCFTLVGAYKDSAMKLTMDTYAWGVQLYDAGDYDKSADVFHSMGQFSDAPSRANQAHYSAAIEAMNSGRYDEASARYNALGDYKDSRERANIAAYSAAEEKLQSGEYADAREEFKKLNEYSDSSTKVLECDYRSAVMLLETAHYEEAKNVFVALGTYNNAADLAKECDYQSAKKSYNKGEYQNALDILITANLSGFGDSDEIMSDCQYQLGRKYMESFNFYEAAKWFDAAGSYSDSEKQAKECRYQLALMLKATRQYDTAIIAFTNISDYRDSRKQIDFCYEAQGQALETSGDYEKAYEMYEKCGNSDKMKEVAYKVAQENLNNCDYENAANWFERAEDYNDAKNQMLTIAEYYFSTQQYDLAERVYFLVKEESIAMQRLYELGKYYELQGDLKRALKAYQGADMYRDASVKAEMTLSEITYQEAGALFAANRPNEAKALYQTISGYKDVDFQIRKCDNDIKTRINTISEQFSVGSYVTFGMYPQTTTGGDITAIEWLILALDGNKVLLISRYGLDLQKYNEVYTNEIWEGCSLRAWLNGDFLSKAFSTKEQDAIAITTVDNSYSQGNSEYGTVGGNNTQDKVFLLSYGEACKYFKSNEARMCMPTDYAINQGVFTVTYNHQNICAWWLRSPGKDQCEASHVDLNGTCSSRYITNNSFAIRPALWLDMEFLIQ